MKIRELNDDYEGKKQRAAAAADASAQVQSTANQQIQAAAATASAAAAAADTAYGREAKALQAIGPTLISGPTPRALDSPDGVNIHVTNLNSEDTDVPADIVPPEPEPTPTPEPAPPPAPEPVPNPETVPTA
jgi:hypothetical protein